MASTITREYALRLLQQREEKEQQISTIVATLNGPGMPGEFGSLVDSQGFPISGVDLYQVRTLRRTLHGLRWDCQQLTNEIDRSLQVLLARGDSQDAESVHQVRQERAAQRARTSVQLQGQPVQQSAVAVSPASVPHPETQSAPQTAQPVQTQPAQQQHPVAVDVPNGEVQLVPIFTIERVLESSPAYDAGLQPGDKIIKFGPLLGNPNMNSQEVLRRLPDIIQDHIGVEMEVRLLRPTDEEEEVVELIFQPKRWSGQGYFGCFVR